MALAFEEKIANRLWLSGREANIDFSRMCLVV
ncbi:hypothetical protein P3T18_001097 [Paraburkholderia sp. GAS199]